MLPRTLLALLLAATVTACGPGDEGNPNADTDVDGLSAKQEARYGTDANKPDTDGDGLTDGAEVERGLDPVSPDSDHDGVKDGDELRGGLNAKSPDTDSDGLNDGEEAKLGAKANDPDSDDDGITDGAEVAAGTDPLKADTDGDGLTDRDEKTLGTNPLKADTDLDGAPDGAETAAGTNPLKADSDDDALFDGDETRLGTDPVKPDTDGDSLLDGAEVEAGTDPLRKDTDADGIDDAAEVKLGSDPKKADADADPDRDGLSNAKELEAGTKIDDPDTDDDTLLDGIDPNPLVKDSTEGDRDGDGLPDAIDPNPDRADADGDGLLDSEEDRDRNGLIDPGETDPRRADTDGDGLVDGEETTLGDDGFVTDPATADTDGDGLLDGVDEDPTDAEVPAEHGDDGDGDGVPDATDPDPAIPDTDGDGLLDGQEDANGDGVLDAAETDATKFDTDGDGLSDFEERIAGDDGYVTDPRRSDTDGDGLLDGIDADPTVPADPGTTANDRDGDGVPNAVDGDPDDADQDDDGLLDGQEDVDRDGTTDAGETDATKADTDDDGLGDALEKLAAGTDPLNADSDDDALADGQEDANRNGRVDTGETDPTRADTDGDGLEDGAEKARGTDPLKKDSDGDGLDDGREVQLGTDPTKADTDGDGIEDGREVSGGSDPKVDDRAADPDKDGVSNAREAELGTRADVPDTDADGLLDGVDPFPLDRFRPGASLGDTDGDGIADGKDPDPLLPDTDGDGLLDGQEDRDRDGLVDSGETSARLRDTDSDGLSDGQEDRNRNLAVDEGETDPLNPDMDGDRALDGFDPAPFDPAIPPYVAPDRDHDGLPDEYDAWPDDADFDGDGLKDGQEDLDKDGTLDAGETDPTKADSDADGLNDGQEDANGNGVVDAGETNPLNRDTDGDSILDSVDPDPIVAQPGDPNVPPSQRDTDGDGLTDVVDPSPTVADTDGDGLLDGQEDRDKDGTVDPGETDPRKADSDADGLVDGYEDFNRNGRVDASETNPLNPDTDNDGLLDAVDPNPLTSDARPAGDSDGDGVPNAVDPAPTDPDADDDGLLDGMEDRNKNGTVDAGETDPRKADSDADALLDGREDKNFNGRVDGGETDPLKWDTDGDGISDGEDLAPLDPAESQDSDGDGRPDGVDTDDDEDGLTDVEEGEAGTDGFVTNPLKADTDEDGIGDRTDLQPLVPDADGDGLLDGEEDKNGNGIVETGETNPLKVDSDDDGLDDGVEIENGTDPLVRTLTITGIFPSYGTQSGGTTFEVTGTGFTSGMVVKVGGNNSTNVAIVSNRKLTARTPASATAGAADVVLVDNEGGSVTATGGFTYTLFSQIIANTTIGPTETKFEDSCITVDGPVTVTIDGTHRFQCLILKRGATATHSPGGKMDLKVTSIVEIDATSRLDVSGKGLLDVLPGTGTLSSTSGASHGGAGGTSLSPVGTTNEVYGQYQAPLELGSGNKTVRGGGAVRLDLGATGQLKIDGLIAADGANAQTASVGGAAGGSIFVSARRLEGAGTIRAAGGSSTSAGGGGGGRIAIEKLDPAGLIGNFSDSNLYESITARGGNGAFVGGAGTVFLKTSDQKNGDLVVDNGGRLARTPLRTPPAGTVSAITTSTVKNFSLAMTPDLYVGALLKPNVNANTTKTLADDPYFTVTANDATTFTLNGDPTTVAASGDLYRGLFIFDNLDVRGGAQLSTSGDILVLSGDRASGDATTFVLAGAVNANYLELKGLDRMIVKGSFGTIDVADTVSEVKNVDLANATGRFESIRATGAISVINSTVTTGRLSAGGNVTVTSSRLNDVQKLSGQEVALTQASTVTPLLGDTGGLAIEARAKLTVDATSLVDATGKGFDGTRTGLTRAGTGVAGSYGGSANGAVNAAYGFYGNPKELGSGGHNGRARGGGLVKVAIGGGGTLVLDGAIRADGAFDCSGSGSGGAIHVTATALSGTGRLTANGGGADSCTGGGGGRVALLGFDPKKLTGSFADPALYDMVSAFGGKGSRPGSAGTVYLKAAQQAWGDLVVNNDGVLATTTLPSVPDGILDIVKAEYVESGSNLMVADLYAGSLVNPNVAQNATETLTDDTFVRVGSNTQTQLFVDSDPRVVAKPGDRMRAAFVLDNLEVRGSAQLSTTGDILVLEGDRSSADAATYVTTGAVNARYLEFRGLQKMIVKGSFGAVNVADSISSVKSVEVFNATGRLETIRATDGVTIVNSTLATSRVTAGGVVSMTKSTLDAAQKIKGQEVQLADGTLLRHPAGDTGGLTVEAKTKVTIDATSAIDVTARGWTGTRAGLTPAGSSAGGSYGGSGNGATNQPYGSYGTPKELGSGGHSGSSRGGGLVKVVTEAGGEVVVNGAIRADGQYYCTGSGSGGAVSIEAAAISGTGTISANGGGDVSCAGGAGGGGRVAIVGFDAALATGSFADPALYEKVTAFGGKGSRPGSAGTVFLKAASQLRGDLVVNNDGVMATTTLPGIAESTVEIVKPDRIEDARLTMVADLYAGTLVNPNVAQNATETLADDTFVRVTSNSATQLFVASDPTLVAKAGDRMRAVHVFDNLEVRGSAQLATAGDILVYEGDRSSGNATTYVTNGVVNARYLELKGLQRFIVKGAFGTVSPASRMSEVAAVELVGATGTLPNIKASDSIQIVNSNLTLGTTGDSLDATTSIRIAASTLSMRSAKSAGTLTIEGSTITAQQLAGREVALTKGSTVTHPLGDAAGLTIDAAQKFSVEAGSTIDVTAKGFSGTRTGLTLSGSSTGGSYGGLGGGGTPNVTYGHYASPAELGSGGHSGNSRGGGLVRVRMETAGQFRLDGTIKADGQAYSNGGGSGGGVYVFAQDFGGTGTITANGGTASYGGGGGRIALVGFDRTKMAGSFADTAIYEKVTAFGGKGTFGGGAGTVFVKAASQANGDLIVNNDGTTSATTPLPTIPEGSVEVIAQNRVENSRTTMFSDLYVGYLLNPNVAQNETSTLTDDTFFKVTSNNATQLFLAGDPRTVAATGNTLRAVFVFDSLEVRGGGRLTTAGDILVYEGDRASNDATSYITSGEVVARTLELRNVDRVRVSGGIGSVNALAAVSNLGTLELINATGTLDTIKAREAIRIVDSNITFTGPATSLDAAQSIAITNSTVVMRDAITAGPLDVYKSNVTARKLKAGELTISQASTLTHAAGDVAGLSFEGMAKLIVDDTSRIDVTAKGWNGTRPGLVVSGSNSGGSYGGLGGPGSTPNPTYGYYGNPNELGSGGHGGASRGGGLVRIRMAANGVLTLNGPIKADGQTYTWGNGSGGGVYVETTAITGTGTISANGGDAGQYYGGGGGRIALVGFDATKLAGNFTDAKVYDSVTAFGGRGANKDGGAGTIFLKSAAQTHGDLVVNNNGAIASTPLPGIPEANVQVLKSDRVGDTRLTLVPDLYTGYLLNPNAAQNATATLADDTFLEVKSNTATELVLDGDPSQLAKLGDAMRSVYVFDNLEVRGGAQLSTPGDILVLQGDRASNDAITYQTTGAVSARTLELKDVTRMFVKGAFGAVTTAGSLRGVPSVEIIGATGSVDSIRAGDSIVVVNSTLTIGATDSLSASQTLRLVNSTVTMKAATTAGRILVEGGNVSAQKLAAGEISLSGNAVVTHAIGDTAGLLVDAATKLTVEAGSRIDVSGKGYSGTWPGLTQSGTYAGGSYGGTGGSNSGQPNLTYGYYGMPAELGSGGHSGNSRGGGLVRVKLGASGTFTLNGSIVANGDGHPYGGGSGGGVLVEAPALGGTGVIAANGGDNLSYGGGGGGRIALLGYDPAKMTGSFADATIMDKVNAFGGRATYGNGGAGTVFLKSKAQAHGDLVVANNGVVGVTHLPSVPETTVEIVTADRVENSQLKLAPNHFAGYLLNPDVAQNATTTLADDTFLRITSNTASQLVLEGDPRTLASVGSPMRAVFVFDNLEVRGAARLITPGDILVHEGDRVSGDRTTYVTSGEVVARFLELKGVDRMTVAAGIGSAGSLGAVSEVGVLDLIGATGTIAQLKARDAIRITDSNLTLGTGAAGDSLAASTSIRITNSTVTLNTATTAGTLTIEGSTVTAKKLSAREIAVTKYTPPTGAPVASTLTHAVGDPAGLTLADATRLTVDATSRIDVSAKGYAGTRPGLTVSGGSTGGSYGGSGGGGTPNLTYGHYAKPEELGSGGHGGASRGGGLVRIRMAADGAITLDGSIRADGQLYTNGNGSGGAVSIETTTLQGAGLITSNGGDPGSNFGGGGGRIAITGFSPTGLGGSFAEPAIYGKVVAYGGKGYTRDGGAGTVYLKSAAQTHGDLVVDNNSNTNSAAPTPLPAVPEATIESLAADRFSDSRLNMPADLYVGYLVNPNVAQNGTATLADDTFFRVTGNTATQVVLTNDSGATLAAPLVGPGDRTRAVYVFDNLEVRNAAQLTTPGDILVMSGDRSSGDGTTYATTGAVNSRSLELKDVQRMIVRGTFASMNAIDGIDDVRFIGANGRVESVAAGATLYVEGSTLTFGTGVDSLVAKDSISLVGSTLTLRTARTTGRLLLDGSTVTAQRLSANEVTLKNATATHAAGDTAGLTIDGATKLTVDAASRLDANAKGYSGTRPGLTVSASYTGGSYGGAGGGNATPNATYGWYGAPNELGSGGHSGNGRGGGLVRVRMAPAGAITLDGLIRADGDNYSYGGGSGGAVYVETDALGGTGRISANGGEPGAYGGGGGRIAIVAYDATKMTGSFADASIYSKVTAFGGTSAGAGTVFLKSAAQTHGDLVVNNNARIGSTPLPTIPEAALEVVASTHVENARLSMPADLYAGYLVNPDVAQNATATLADDTFLRVTGNGANRLLLESDPRGVTSVGRTMRAIFVLDNLEVRGGAQLSTAGDILVLGGDRASADNTTLRLNGAVNARYLELAGIQRVVYEGDVGTVLAGDRMSVPEMLHVVGATGTLGDVAGEEIRLANSTVTATSLAASTLVALANTTLTAPIITSGGTISMTGSGTVTTREVSAPTTIRIGAGVTVKQTTGEAAGLLFKDASQLYVDAGARIDVVGAGLATPFPGSGTAGSYAGGSYGGAGGIYSASYPTNRVYGHYASPKELGSASYNGARGGGRIRIELPPGSVLTVDGDIKADGLDSTSGASGGSIAIRTASLTGSGNITAIGGAGSSYCGGGGGRIAITGLAAGGLTGSFAGTELFNRVLTRGGPGASPTWHGAAGTTYLKRATQTYGDLVVDNKGYAATTPMVDFPNNGVIDAVLDASIVNLVLNMVPDYYVGYLLKPNASHSLDGDLRNDVVLPITANSKTEFFLDVTSLGATPLRNITAKNGSYRPAYVLDNLEVRGSATLSTTGDILVREGDLTNDNTTSFALGAGAALKVNALDLNTATKSGPGTITGSVYTH